MRVLVDSSVLISAFLRPGLPRDLLSAAREGRFALCLSDFLRAEVGRGLRKARNATRYRYTPQQVEAFIADTFGSATLVVTRLPTIEPVCRDPNDDHVLAAAVAAGAGSIVTGDADLLTLGQYRGIRILGVRAFLAEL